jgi:hypothetical protein
MSLRGISPIRESHPSRIAAWIAIALLVVVVFAVGWPGVHGFWGRDDYFQLALARMIGSPWPLFAHDHFPVPHSVFRPLGFASMWLDTRLFGTEYAPHAVCDLALHAGAALALFGVLRRAFVSPFAAALAALAFALHPAASGTAQWWSARFDVLATLFVLLALQAALAYRARPSALALGAALLAAFAAMASKEIGLVAPAVLFLIWLRWAWREPRTRGRALRACAYALACAALFLVWRASVLGTATSGLLGGASLGAVLGAGLPGCVTWAAIFRMRRCSQRGNARCSDWPRSALSSHGLFRAGILVRFSTRMRRRGQRRREPRVAISSSAVCACCCCPRCCRRRSRCSTRRRCAPIFRRSRRRCSRASTTSASLAQRCCWGRCCRRCAATRGIASAASALALIVFGGASHSAAHQFARRSMQISGIARAAVSAVDALPRADGPCRIFFLGVEQAPEWGGFVSMDSIVKALDERGDVARCWIHADMPTYFHLQSAAVMAADAAPWTPLEVDGKAVPWLHVGALTIAFVAAPPALDAQAIATTRFLRWQNGRFDDVSAEVANGSIAAKLQ